MKLENVVPFGRPLSGKVIIQVMTEYVVTGTAIPKPFGEQFYE